MRLGTAIERLVDNYRYAKSKVWIRDEVAWALYHTWKEANDRKTEQTAECPFDDDIPCEWVCTEYGKCKYKTEPQTERSE